MRTLVLVVVLAACGKSSDEPKAVPVGSGDTKSEPTDDPKPNDPTKPVPGRGRDAGLAQGSGAPFAGILVEPGELTATADVDKDAVRKVVKANVQKLQLCYEQALLANPGIEGKIVVTFTIGIEGVVGDVSANGIHPDVETCVADKFRAFKFPKPSVNKVEVQYPFTFRPA